MRLLLLFFSLFSFLLAKDTLTVYSYNSFAGTWGPAKELKEEFEKTCNCEISFIGVGDGVSALNRLKLEGSKSKADIILGLDGDLLEVARSANLVQKHQVMKPELSTEFWSEDFIPYDHGYLAFIYDASKTQDKPKTLKDFIQNADKASIIYQDPRTSILGKSLLLWINKLYPEEAQELYKILDEKTATITKSWTEAYSLFKKGESDFVLSYSTSPAVHLKEGITKYQALIFDDGNYEEIETAAITKNAKNLKLANEFLTFLLSEPAQKIIMNKNIMYTSIKMELPPEFQDLEKVKIPLSYSPKEVLQKQKEFIKQWQNALI